MTTGANLIGALVLATACGGSRRASADATPPPSPPTAAAVEDAERGVDPRRFEPYFHEGRAGEAVALLNQARYPEARQAFLEFAGSLAPESVLVPRARFVAAVAAHRAGEHEAALDELSALAESLPLLSDHALYMASVSAYRLGRYERAVELAGSVSASSPLRADAELVVCDATRALGRADEVERVYRDYVHRERGGPRLDEATFRLAEAIEARGSGPAGLERVREAIGWYRRVLSRHPQSRWAREAETRIAALARRLPASERRSATKLGADEQLARAEVFARGQRHPEAMREFEKVLELTDPDGPTGCRARLGRGRAAFNARKRALADTVLSEAAERCAEPDVRAWSLYFAGRARTSSGQDRRAAQAFETLETDHPGHRLADDARLRRAQALQRLGEAETAARLLAELPADFPTGDMRCEASWQLAWQAYRAGRLDEALPLLRRAVELCDRPEEGGQGRELYWTARTLERQGASAEAAATYEGVVRSAPLSYYMMLAVGRLGALDRARADGLLAELTRPPADERELRIDPAALRERPGLVRGIELLRLRLESLARIELAASRSEVRSDEDLLWLIATLHHQAGDYGTSHSIARSEVRGWRRSYPVGESRRAWLIAYPRPFAELVEPEAAASGIEPELMYAVMREESGFSPSIESFANAVGLLQLLPTTAARFARGLPADRVSLCRPEVNVPIAGRYLRFLLDRNDGVPLLSIAGYNAGEGAVDRWRRAEPDLELDEALEAFTYDETRRYTRRVLSSYAAYHFLYGRRVPEPTRRGGGCTLPAAEPTELSSLPGPGAPARASSDAD